MIEGYIDRIEEDKAVILLGDDYKTISFPMKYLPDGLGSGDYVTIDIQKAADKEDEDDLLDLWQSTKG